MAKAGTRRPEGRKSGLKTKGQRLKTDRPTVGVIGLGIMGSAMAASLVRTGYRVVGYDMLPKPRRVLRRTGGEAVHSSLDVAAAADIIITSLPSSDALLQVATELSGRKTKDQRPKTIIVETSTLPISVREDARARLATRGITLLDCPLSGTGAQAKTGDLVVYASGDRTAYRRAVPVFEGFSRAHYYVGPFGAGSKTKFVANLLVAIHNVAAAEALVLAKKAGLDPAMVLDVVAAGVGSSRVLQLRGPMMVRGKYTPATMKLGVWQKDMQIIREFARAVGCPTPLFAATAPLYASALAMGLQAEDTAAVCTVLEGLAGLARRSGNLV